MNVFLIGFPGVGKSTYGKELAELMSFEFLDSDSAIEASAKSTVAQIFKSKGEEHFRALEKSWLTDFKTEKDTIIACGGGIPCFEDNLEVLKSKGTVVYLKCFEDDAIRKLEESPENYPILSNIADEKQRSFISDLFRKRSYYYSKTDIVIYPSQLSADKCKELLLELLTPAV